MTLRRRRRTAAGAALCAAALIAAVVLLVGGDSGGDEAPTQSTAGDRQRRVGGSQRDPLRSTAGWRRRRGPVPILMYHVIAPYRGVGVQELFVKPRDFAAQMRWLKKHGFVAVTIAEVERAWRGTRSGTGTGKLPRRPVVVSFDDGYDNQFTKAEPVLAGYRWPGVINLQVSSLKHAGGLSPKRVRALIGRGWELAAHTLTHPDLTTVAPARLRREVLGSRRLLRRRFHVPVDHFCYPAGKYSDAVVAVVRRSGFHSASTVESGLATRDDPLRLKRLRVDGSDGVPGFVQLLRQAGL